MRILSIGDVVGRTGRKVVGANLSDLRRRLELDFVILNGENAAHGFGITRKICKQFYTAGVDVITTGNHVWNNPDILAGVDEDRHFIRPLNLGDGVPGRGSGLYTLPSGKRIFVAQVMGRLFMNPVGDPFAAAETALENCALGSDAAAIVVDIHAEATSEKLAMGYLLDGRVSLVSGTHTHVPSDDARILPGGTAFVSDLGMCGDYDSIIGMKKEAALDRFRTENSSARLEPADGEATLSAVLVETDDKTGLARTIEPLRMGGRLAPRWPGGKDEPAA